MLVARDSRLILCVHLLVDSQLAKETNVGVQEMVNGCMCCVLIGQMKLALEELRGKKIKSCAIFSILKNLQRNTTLIELLWRPVALHSQVSKLI